MNYPLALKNGTVLADDYRIEGILGAGGSGITYIAKEISLDREIAIKEYFPSDFAMRQDGTQVCAKTQSDEEDYVWGLDRFIEEAQTLAKFDHSNIVRVFRYFQTHNTAYMVLKFEEGQNFKTWLAELDRAPSQAELDVILTPLLDALELIHADEFLHRDIAPDNIIIRRNGSPVLIDFGSARRVITNRPKTVSALIKPGYSPFEQYAMTGKDQGPWTDIYSLAATLYHAVTGKRPLDSPTRMVGDDLKSAVKSARPGYRQEFLKAIDSALELKTRERPQSIQEWREQLFAVSASPVAQKAAKSKKPKKSASSAKTPVSRRKTGKKAKANKAAEVARRPTETTVRHVTNKKSLLQKVSRQARRSVIRFLAEHARNDGYDGQGAQGGLANRLSDLRLLSDDLKNSQDRNSNTASAGDNESNRPGAAKANLIKKILASPHEADKKEKPPTAPNKSFEPIGPTQTAHAKKSGSQPSVPVVTVRLKRNKMDVKPGPTTEARARLLDKRDSEKTQKKTRRISRFSIALRTLQMLMILMIVLPTVYFLNLEDNNTSTGSITASGADLIRTINGHYAPVTSLTFTPQGDRLISGGKDNNLRIWDTYTGSQLKLLNAHRADVTALDVKNEFIVSSDAQGEMIIWNLKTGKALKNFQAHQNVITSVLFAGADRKIVSGSTDKTLKVWDTNNTRKEKYALKPHKAEEVKLVAYAPKRQLIATAGSKNDVRLWNIKTGRLVRSYWGHEEGVSAIAFSPDGGRIATASKNIIRIWSTRSRRQYRSIRIPGKEGVTALTFSPNGGWIASAGTDNTIKVWNWRKRQLAKTLSGHTGRINTVTFTPDSRRIASASEDHTIRLWKAPPWLGR